MDLTYFNPNHQDENSFLKNFIARQAILEFFLRQLRLTEPGQPARHHLIVAPRGYGKTSLLRRIALAIRDEGGLREKFIALRFREEQHNVISLDLFWRNCLESLLECREEEHAPAVEIDDLEDAWEKHAPRQELARDQQDGLPAWQELKTHCENLGRRPVLLIDNFDSMLAGLSDHYQWSLRKILQSDDGPVLLAAAPRYPDSVHDGKAAFYDFFRVQTLDKLDNEEVLRCLRSIALSRGGAGEPVLSLLESDPGRVAALNTLAGGNPRTLNVLYSVLESHLSAEVFSQLGAMLDTFTGWYQARTEEMPMQARAVFDALALNWDPMTAAALGAATGLDTQSVNSQLSRLERGGFVETVQLSSKGQGRNGYQVSERFFNIWYLMRNGSRRTRNSVRFLTAFLQSCFNAKERRYMARNVLADNPIHMELSLALASRESNPALRQRLLDHARYCASLLGRQEDYQDIAASLPAITRGNSRAKSGLDRIQPVSSLKNAAPGAQATDKKQHPSKRVKAAADLVFKADEFFKSGKLEKAIVICDRMEASIGDADELELREEVARALVNKGVALGELGRPEQAIEAYDRVVARFGEADEPALRDAVARALVNKGAALCELGHPEQAVDANNCMEARFGETDELAPRELLARALVNMGVALERMGRPEQAIETYDRMEARFGKADEPVLRELVALALFNKGVVLGQLGCLEQAIKAYDHVEARFGEADEPARRVLVARAMVNKGVALGHMRRLEQAIDAYDRMVACFGEGDDPALRELVALALFNKGVALGQLGQPEQDIKAYDRVVARFGEADELALREAVSRAFVNKGVALDQMGRPEQAIEAYDHVETRLGKADEPALSGLVARAMVNKGVALGRIGRLEQAIEAYDRMEARFGEADDPMLRGLVARAMVNKGVALRHMGRPEQAIEAYDRMEARFGEGDEPALSEQVARVLVNKGFALGQMGCPEQAIEAYDLVEARYGEADEPVLREAVALALVNKGFALGQLGRPEQAIKAYDRVEARFGMSGEPLLREQVAGALFNMGGTLDQLGRPEQAVEVYDRLVAHFSEANEPALRLLVARAMVNKGVALGQMGCREQAIKTYNYVEARFGEADEPALREQVARALVQKAITLGDLQQPSHGIQVCDTVLGRFGEAQEPQLQKLVSQAFEINARLLTQLGQVEAALDAYQAAIALNPDSSSILNSLGNLYQDYLGDPKQALSAFADGLAKAAENPDQALLHANRAYALALHGGDKAEARRHAEMALQDGVSISVAGRHLLEALPIWGDSPKPNWKSLFAGIGKAVDCEDNSLWNNYLVDLQRLIEFVVRHGEGSSLKHWMEDEQYAMRQAPLYHAVVAVLDGEDHLLRINPETREPAKRIYDGIVRLTRLYSLASPTKKPVRSKKRK